jgi:hypothetical protein
MTVLNPVSMSDIHLGIGIVLALSAVLGYVAHGFARRAPRPLAVGLIVAALVLLGLNVAYFRHSLRPAAWFPFSNMIILADPNPELTAIVAGAALALMPGRLARRLVLIVPMVALCLRGSYAPLFDGPPRLENRWRLGVCRQTSGASCAAASAATLLATRGIDATEAEMARLCLTTPGGTSSRGLYRGLKLKTAGTGFVPVPFHGDIDGLREAGGPVLLTVRLDPGPGVDPRFSRDWGWAPGVTHNVVLLACTADGRFMVGDPADGPEFWDRGALETLWKGEGIRLLPSP